MGALDLLSQAEHGSGDEIAVCVCESKVLASRIASALTKEITSSPVRDTFLSLSEEAISIFVTPSRKESIALINEIAPEHLQIMTKDSRKDLENHQWLRFLGSYTPVALGLLCRQTGPAHWRGCHSLPRVDSFLKSMSVAEIA